MKSVSKLFAVAVVASLPVLSGCGGEASSDEVKQADEIHYLTPENEAYIQVDVYGTTLTYNTFTFTPSDRTDLTCRYVGHSKQGGLACYTSDPPSVEPN